MPVAKLPASGTTDFRKTDDGNDSLDTIIRQAIGKEPLLSFPRAGVSPVQWIQLLNALDQQGLPLLSPVKVHLQKCNKCSREFCSPINYRRHIRIQHRLKKLDKDSDKNRDLLGAYWDKLSVEEAKEVVSFKNVMLEEVPGSSILEALTTLRKQGFSSLPQYYLRAGSALLNIVQSRPSSFPKSSQELFSILDDSSEKTFLVGSAVSMQRYVFDGEAGKIGLEPKNLVACTSFLLEQNLVKAWLADKDAEALRCQKLLVEEEEAAQKRKYEILERKHQKKLRQKEHKARERLEDDTEIKENIRSTGEDVSPTEASSGTCDFEAHNPDIFADNSTPPHVTSRCLDNDEVIEGVTLSGYDFDTDQYIERQTSRGHNHRRIMATRWQGLPKSQWAIANGSHPGHNSQMSKLGVIQKHGTNCDQRVAPIVNGSKFWSRKPKPETNGVVLKAKLQKEPDKCKNHEVLIGSVSVCLGNCSHSEGNLVAPQRDSLVDNLAKQNTAQEKPVKHDSSQGSNGRLTVKLWRPVSQHGTKDLLPLQNGGTEADVINGKYDLNLSGQCSLRLCSIDGSDIGFGDNFSHTGDSESLRLSSHAAKAFLVQRWKEAISSNHVKLFVTPDCQSTNADRCSIIANSENRLPATSGVAKSKPKTKLEKGMKIKYIPKQKATT
ncbi:uncharacterized protein LOC114403666 [Glycine soja]|uniref:C2H2-type domain-containing protein n=1 Tax=Glycine soja TaxID=3848 RepID=A0A0B2PWR6_GLYSO|nr:uncharacterized protein LOC114403666 [Glycine soja]KHN12149.1 hypothetical protein glysoja_044632 [Glycine soja]RZB44188.1 hypothetical protein D0Y65_054280 [Glycine soja]